MTIRAFRPAQRVLFADAFDSALSAAWVASGASVVNGAMKIDPGTGAWNNKVYAMLGVPDSLAGNTLIGPAPADFDAVFQMTLTDTNQQYPHIGLRVQPRTASGAPDNQWNGGGGDGGFKLGYDLVLRVQEGDVQVMNNRTGATVGAASVGFATLGRFLNWRVLVRGSRIAFKVWAVGATEPGTYSWTFDSDTAAADTTPGYIGFTASSGPSGNQPVLIDNLTVTAAA